MKNSLNKKDGMVFTAEESVADLEYIDDGSLTYSGQKVKEITKRIVAIADITDLATSILKTKCIATENDTYLFIHSDRDPIERVIEFKYLRALMDAKG